VRDAVFSLRWTCISGQPLASEGAPLLPGCAGAPVAVAGLSPLPPCQPRHLIMAGIDGGVVTVCCASPRLEWSGHGAEVGGVTLAPGAVVCNYLAAFVRRNSVICDHFRRDAKTIRSAVIGVVSGRLSLHVGIGTAN
jgi:hypothetical protein